jgi:type III pantothenate kinase
MLLVVDIGNTTVSFAVLRGRRVLRTYLTPTQDGPGRLRAELKKVLGRIKKEFPKVVRVILCGVVPDALNVVEKTVVICLKIRPEVIGRDIKVPMKNNYRDPRQVGQDRLVCAYAARCLYGCPAVVIDFGTAITFDVVSHRGEYEGGIIIPGIRLSAESLFQKTALLPRVDTLQGPRSLIGRDTRGSILSGLFFGYGAMSRGLIEQITQQIKGKPKVVMTGGHTRLMEKFLAEKVTKTDKNLVFKGMALLAESSEGDVG